MNYRRLSQPDPCDMWPEAPLRRSPGRGMRAACLFRAAILFAMLAMPLILFCSGCETRDRANPFDPGNPDTGGRPALLTAVAGESDVMLRWDLEMFGDVSSIRIIRSSEREPEQRILEQPGRGSGSHIDDTVENHTTYTYCLQILGPGPDLLSAVPVRATPGLSRPWVGDASGRGAARLSPDGRHVVQRIGAFREVMDLEFTFDGSFWAADFRNGTVLRFDREGELLGHWRHYGVNTLAVDGKLGMIWAGSFLTQTLTLFNTLGEEVWADSSLGFIEQIEAAPAGGGVWVASRTTGVSRVILNRITDSFPDYVWPVAVCPDADGGVWVVDRGVPSVTLISLVGPDSTLIRTADARVMDPRDGAVDDHGGLWVADPERGGVLYIGADLEEQLFLPLGRISSVTWDGLRDRVWLAASEEGRVLVLERTAERADELSAGGCFGSSAVDEEGWTVSAEVFVGGRPSIIAVSW